MSVRDPYPHDVERLVDLAAREASTTDAVRWDMATPTERVLARWVIEARAAPAVTLLGPRTPAQVVDAIAEALPGTPIGKAIEDWQEARRVAWSKYLELRRDLRRTPIETETEATRIRLVEESHLIIRQWGFAPPEAVTREARQAYDEDEPGEVARAQAREPGVRHRRRVLNMLLAAWDANPGAQFGELLARAAWAKPGPGFNISGTTDADLLEGLRRLTRETV